MKVYVASKFENRDTVKDAYKKLSDAGIVITHDWTNHIAAVDEAQRRQWAIDDADGVSAADILIVLFPVGTGTCIEIGLAMGMNKAVYLIDHVGSKSIFYSHPLVSMVSSLDECIERIKA